MEIINIKNNILFLKEYIKLCSLEWGSKKTEKEMQNYIKNKLKKVIDGDNVISILALVEDAELIGFISLFKYDCDERKDLTPWYSTMYVKENFRGRGYSKILNDSIIKEAIRLGYRKLYLKTNLNNYYEKFGAQYIEKLSNGEKLYFIELIN